MGFNKKKYTRVSVDLTKDEFQRLQRAATEQLANKSTYVRAAIDEKIKTDEKEAKPRR